MSQSRKKKKVVWQKYIGFASMMLLGAICGVVMATYIDSFAADDPLPQQLFSLAGLFLGMYAAIFFHLIIHEAGHLVFGLLTGYQFSSFRIASFMWMKENGKLKLKRLTIAGTGGQCLMAPPDLKDGKIPLALYNLGGSLINTIFGALFLIGYWLFPGVPFLTSLLLVFAAVGFMTALINGIPMRMGTVDNDGYNAFVLSRNKEAVEAFWVQLKVAEQNVKGVRIKDMPSHWFTVPTDAAMKTSMVAARGVFAFNRLMDEERFEEADALMAHLLEIDSGIIGLHRGLLICDRIYVELIGENRSEVVADMMSKEQKKFMKAMKRYPSVLRTQYAHALLLERNSEKSQKIKNEFEKIAKTYPYSQEIEAERGLMVLAEGKAAAQK